MAILTGTQRNGTFTNSDPENVAIAATVAKAIATARFGGAVVNRIAPSMTQDGIYAVLVTITKRDGSGECVVWTLNARSESLTGGKYFDPSDDGMCAAFDTRAWNVGGAA